MSRISSFERYVTSDCSRYQFAVDGQLVDKVEGHDATRTLRFWKGGEIVACIHRDAFKAHVWADPSYIMHDTDGKARVVQAFKEWTVEAVGHIDGILYDFD